MTSASSATEVLTLAGFQEELRRVARFLPVTTYANALDATVKKIQKNPVFAQSRLLSRVLTALTYQKGEFRRAEIGAFDAETLAMVINLMNARAAVTSTLDEWVSAVEAARVCPEGSSK